MADSPRGVPGPDLADAADIEAAVNPLRDWVNDNPGNATLTTAERDALSGVDLWEGRTIFNLTTKQLESWDGTVWVAASGGLHPFLLMGA